MGLKLVFKKVPKKLEHGFLIDPMEFYDDPHRLIEPFYNMHPEEKFDLEAEVARLLRDRDGPQWGMEFYPMEFYTLDPEEYRKAHNLEKRFPD